MTTKTTRKMVMVVALVMALLVPITANAAQYPGPNGMYVSVIQGLTTLVLPDGTHKQLTYNDLAKDAGIDANGTCYVIYKSHDGEQGGLLSFYAYKYQTTSTLVELDANVSQFETDSNGYVTGWIRADGTKGVVLTDAQVRQKLNYTGGSNGGSTSGNTSNGTNTNTSTNTNTNTTTNTTVTTPTGENWIATCNPAVLSNGIVTYRGDNGRYYQVNDNNIIAIYTDGTTNTIYFLYRNGELKCWCYELQKNEPTMRLTTISTKATSFGTLGGFYEVGNQNLIPFKTIYELQQLINTTTTVPATTTPNTTTTTTQQTSYKKYYCATGTTTKNLRDSDMVILDKRYWNVKTGVARYHGKTYRKVKLCHFTKYGQLMITYKGGKTIVVNRDNVVIKRLNRIKGYRYTRGMVKAYVSKGGHKYKVKQW